MSRLIMTSFKEASCSALSLWLLPLLDKATVTSKARLVDLGHVDPSALGPGSHDLRRPHRRLVLRFTNGFPLDRFPKVT